MEKQKLKKNELTRKERIEQLVKLMSKDLYEREEVIALSLLVSLTEQSLFFLGPPGTGKSLIARRISSAFNSVSNFENLMQKFSTPEEVFGPVSIKELKNDNYKRKTEGYLPTANFAFLDEIWKSSPAILNTLLTIINERLFKNGSSEEKVPLKTIIAASNETPPKGQGLEALYDRFIARMYIEPINQKTNFEKLLDNHSINSYITIPNHLKIANKEWSIWRKELENVKLSKETLNIINAIRIKFSEKEELDVYVSDRRWQKIALLLKASAYFCNRNETNLVDTLVLRHCLWSREDNREAIDEIVKKTIMENGYSFRGNLAELDKMKDELDKEINDELYYTEDIYKTKTLKNGKKYFEITRYEKYFSSNVTFYVEITKLKTKGQVFPCDSSGNEIKWIKCNFDGTGSCDISIQEDKNPTSSSYWNKKEIFKPDILYHKGDKKEGINKRLINEFISTSEELISKFDSMIKEIKDHIEQIKNQTSSPFIPKNLQNIPLDSINSLLSDMKLRKKDSERLKEMAGSTKYTINSPKNISLLNEASSKHPRITNGL